MNTTGLKVIIDTNVFITIFKKNGKNRWMFDKIISGEWILCISNDIFWEYWEILIEKTTPAIAENIINFIIAHPYIKLVENYFHLNLIDIDKDDNKFCDTFFTTNAVYLISNDKHFNILKEIEFPKIPVFTTQQIFTINFPTK